MEQKELNKILESHERWLRGEDGECANLRFTDLYRADLRRSNLRWVNLAGANLRRADLTEANLCGADLTGASLTGANLRYVDFTEAIGLPVLSVQVNTSWKNRRITYIPSLDVVTAGCFQGTFEEFEKRVEEEHKYNPFVLSRYRRVIAFLKQEAEEDRKRLEQND